MPSGMPEMVPHRRAFRRWFSEDIHLTEANE
jgi:hypothetical protein